MGVFSLMAFNVNAHIDDDDGHLNRSLKWGVFIGLIVDILRSG